MCRNIPGKTHMMSLVNISILAFAFNSPHDDLLFQQPNPTFTIHVNCFAPSFPNTYPYPLPQAAFSNPRLSHFQYALEYGVLLMDLNIDRLALRCFNTASCLTIALTAKATVGILFEHVPHDRPTAI